jgi:hypothetical protein
MNRLSRTLLSSSLLLSGLWAGTAHADAIPYAHTFDYNATTYAFTAASTGDVIAYFMGGFSAGYSNQVGLLVNGVLSSAGYGLNNHASSLGQSFNLGPVNAGDSLVFVLNNLTLGNQAYSDASMNDAYDDSGAPGHNHIYSTAYTATDPVVAGVPTGTYVGFEDLAFPGSDYNYNDESFVFTNVATHTVPEAPMAALLPLLGLAAWLGGRRRRA